MRTSFDTWGPILYGSRMWHISMWHALLAMKSFAIYVRQADSIKFCRICLFGMHPRALATIWLVQLVTWSKCHVQLSRNLSTGRDLSNSLRTVLRMRIGRQTALIESVYCEILVIRLQFQKNATYAMCPVRFSYRILPLSSRNAFKYTETNSTMH